MQEYIQALSKIDYSLGEKYQNALNIHMDLVRPVIDRITRFASICYFRYIFSNHHIKTNLVNCAKTRQIRVFQEGKINMISILFMRHDRGVVWEAYLGISSQSEGITFPFQNKDYDKATNEERKTTDFTAIVKIVGESLQSRNFQILSLWSKYIVKLCNNC